MLDTTNLSERKDSISAAGRQKKMDWTNDFNWMEIVSLDDLALDIVEAYF